MSEQPSQNRLTASWGHTLLNDMLSMIRKDASQEDKDYGRTYVAGQFNLVAANLEHGPLANVLNTAALFLRVSRLGPDAVDQIEGFIRELDEIE